MDIIELCEWLRSSEATGRFCASLRQQLDAGRTLTRPQLFAADRIRAERAAARPPVEPKDRHAGNPVMPVRPDHAGRSVCVDQPPTGRFTGPFGPDGRIINVRIRQGDITGVWSDWFFVDLLSGGNKLPIGTIRPGGRVTDKRPGYSVAAIVAAIAEDPKAATVAYGHATGTCGICGRELTDPASIARGIGPICAENF